MLAFALGGSSEVDELRSLQEVDYVEPDSFYFRSQPDTIQTTTTPFGDVVFTSAVEETKLKPSIKKWLHNASRLADSVHAPWIRLWTNLVQSAFEVDVSSRPDIKDVLVDMELLIAEIDKVYLARYCLWTLHDAPRPPAMELVGLDLVRQQDNLPQIRGEKYDLPFGAILRPNDSALRHTNETHTTKPAVFSPMPPIRSRSCSPSQLHRKFWRGRSFDNSSLVAIEAEADAVSISGRRSLFAVPEPAEGVPSIELASVASGMASLKLGYDGGLASPTPSDYQHNSVAYKTNSLECLEMESRESWPLRPVLEDRSVFATIRRAVTYVINNLTV